MITPGTTRIEWGSTRVERKAQRRTEIRDVAQHLFDQRSFEAVTITDVAAAASVSVQTVFNHFTAKEEFFFDGRTPWVDGLPLAVRLRPLHIPPLIVLREHLVEVVRETVHREATPAGRRYTAAVEASPSLAAYERELVHQSQRRVCEVLTAAWTDGPPSIPSLPEDPALVAGLISATWMTAVREVIVAQRPLDSSAEDRACRAAALTDHVLRCLSHASTALASIPAGARNERDNHG